MRIIIKAIIQYTFSMLLLSIFTTSLTAESPKSWDFISTTEVGAFDFISSNSNYDGRGVLVAVMDTGVDMGVRGLQTTSTGEVKVIEARDFSGEGDLKVKEIPENQISDVIANGLVVGENKRLTGLDDHINQDDCEKLFYCIIPEKHFINTGAEDVNDNGSKDDTFYAVIFGKKNSKLDDWKLIFDRDGDQNLKDEEVISNYHVAQEYFYFQDRDSTEGKSVLAIAPTFLAEEKILSLHYDNGSHGSHCAGIAAGHNLMGQDSLDGIAPGAQIVSLKIGNNKLAGGSTTTGSMKKAILHGVSVANRLSRPMVFNVSYGIAAGTDGKMEIDNLFSKVLHDNPNVFLCTSNGNEGPGISTTGAPAGSKLSLSVGAMLDKNYAQAAYHAQYNHNVLYPFTSRGAEVAKPDVIAPGGAASSVPNWQTRAERYHGTSMASPQATGVIALVMSAGLQQPEPVRFPNYILHRAARLTAKPIPNYTILDQGNGLINVGRTFDWAMKLMRQGETEKLHRYEISTYSPNLGGLLGNTVFWRTGNYFPAEPETIRIYVQPEINKDIDPLSFFRAFRLQTDAEWININNPTLYLKGDRKESISIQLVPEKMRTPGLYSSMIKAYREDDSNLDGQYEFNIWVSVVVPYFFAENHCFERNWDKIELDPHDVTRIFTTTPPGATAAELYYTLLDPENVYANISIFDPQGYAIREWLRAGSPEEPAVIKLTQDDIHIGTNEIDLFTYYRTPEKMNVSLMLRYYGIDSEPDTLTRIYEKENNPPISKLKVTNSLGCELPVTIKPEIVGFRKHEHVKLVNNDTFKREFSFTADQTKVIFTMDMLQETYDQFTDLAVNIFDSSGNSLVSTSFGGKLAFDRPASGSAGPYYLVMEMGFTDTAPGNWEFDLTTDYYSKDTISGTVLEPNHGKTVLYPGAYQNVVIQWSKWFPNPPVGFTTYGNVKFVTNSGLEVLSVPIEWKPTE